MSFLVNSHRFAGYSSTKSLLFDGVNERMTINGLLTTLSSDNIGSISCWINAVDVTPSTHEDIISFGDNNANEYLAFRMKITTGEVQVVSVIGGSVKINASTTIAPFTNNTWHHLVIVQNATEFIIYVDDTQLTLSYTTAVDKTIWINDYSTLDNVTCGCRDYNSSVANFFNGYIDELAVYDTNLSSGDVTTLYNSGCPTTPSETNLVGYWKMGEGDTYPTITDNSTNSNDGTMTNMESGDISVSSPC